MAVDKERLARIEAAVALPVGLTVIDRDQVVAKPARRSRLIKTLADEIFAFTKLPRLSWGFAELDKYAPFIAGGLVVVIGATGRGKTSFVLQCGRRHARNLGPTLIISAELVGSIAGARMVSAEVGRSWISVLSGKESLEGMRDALDAPNMRIIDEVESDIIAAIEAELIAFAEEFPGKPALVIVDYIQLLPGGEEIRHRVTDNIVALRKLAAKYGAGAMIISKAGRGAAQALRKGEAVGTDTTEGGSETNAIEHEAIALVALGAMKPVDDIDPDGPSIVDVSIAKARFGMADKIVPLRFDGATGRFEEHGPAISAADRRAEAKSKNMSVKTETLARSIRMLVSNSDTPLSKSQITEKTTGNNTDIAAAIRQLEADGQLVQVAGKKSGGHWPYWTPEQANKAGIAIVPQAVIDHA